MDTTEHWTCFTNTSVLPLAGRKQLSHFPLEKRKATVMPKDDETERIPLQLPREQLPRMMRMR